MRVLTSTTFLAVLLALSTNSAWAQAGWYVTPSFSLTEEYDDNVFAKSSGEKSDFITRLSPGLKAGYRSAPLTFEGGYSFDAEVFAKNPELSDEANRQRAGLDLKYLPTHLLTLSLNTSYTETETPTELVPETGIEIGRGRATQLAVSPSVSYQFTPLTSGDAAYSYTRGEASGGVTNVTQQTTLALSHQFTPADKGMLDYRLRRVESDGSGSTTSHASTVGWSRQFTELTSLTSKLGARVTEGAVGVETSSTLTHQFRLARVSATYARSEATVIGRTGPVETESLSGSVAFEPVKLLQVNLAPSVRKSSREKEGEGSDTTVYGFNGSASYPLTRWLSARAAYRFSLQEGGRGEILHNVFSIGLDITYPTRLD